MSTQGGEERSGREIRLLGLVIAVAVAVLLVLARFRFPAADIVAVSPPSPGPLERLVAPPPFVQLASGVADATARITPLVRVVEFERVAPKAQRKGAPPPLPLSVGERWVPALRVRPNAVMSYAPASLHAKAIGGTPVQVLAADARRELALEASGDTTPPSDVVDLTNAPPTIVAPTYVMAVEGAAGGPSMRPVFIPRVDQRASDRWPSPLFGIGGTPLVGAGTLLFTMEGHFIGMVVVDDDGAAVLPAAALDRVLIDLTGGGK